MYLLSISGSGIDLKGLLICLLILAFLGFLAWLAGRLPNPFNWLAWVVLGIAAFFIVIRTVEGM